MTTKISKEMPDTPSPKDLATLALLNSLNELVPIMDDDVTALAKKKGWGHYNCSPVRYDGFLDQHSKVLGRLKKQLTDSLHNRGIDPV